MLQMSEEQADRNLTELADLLDQVQARGAHFDMQRWVKVGLDAQRHTCCTPSCAAGWWAHHRYALEGWPQGNNPRSNARYFSNMIERDFAIAPESASFSWLFGAHPHRTAADEARAIRAFVQERGLLRSGRF
ncbi:MAG TPA: hypothetical protein VMD56_08425 [Steroidobacteraceae bacterium]|nr:hypothetical protein [Steroidobacteraceae bacterium]